MRWKVAVVLALVVFAIAQFVHVAHAPATVVEGKLLYGPYIRAERGSYRATFFVRFQGHPHIDADAVVATLDVWAEGRTLATQELRQHEVDASTWTPVEVPFEVPSHLSKLETRVRFAGRGRLDVVAEESGR